MSDDETDRDKRTSDAVRRFDGTSMEDAPAPLDIVVLLLDVVVLPTLTTLVVEVLEIVIVARRAPSVRAFNVALMARIQSSRSNSVSAYRAFFLLLCCFEAWLVTKKPDK